jgi:hypothetical protein
MGSFNNIWRVGTISIMHDALFFSCWALMRDWILNGWLVLCDYSWSLLRLYAQQRCIDKEGITTKEG